jgi:hypothetical protein
MIPNTYRRGKSPFCFRVIDIFDGRRPGLGYYFLAEVQDTQARPCGYPTRETIQCDPAPID